jgi:hypothetical protein
LLIAGCSNKVSYQNAYKFDRHAHGVRTEAKQSSPLTEGAPLIASTTDLRIAVEPTVRPPVMEKQPGTKQRQPARLLVPSLRNGQIIQAADTTSNPASRSAREPLKSRNWAAITSLVLILTFFIFPLHLLMAIPAIIFGIIGLRSERRGLAVAGIILNIILFIITFVIAASFSI